MVKRGSKKITSKKKLKYLKQIYGTPSQPASFTSPSKLFEEVEKRKRYKFTLAQIKWFLSQRESYLVSKDRREKSKKPHYIAHFKFELLVTDLMYMLNYKSSNDGIQYLLTCMDAFSRMLFVRALKDRQSETVVKAFQSILDEIDHPILSCTSDRGVEYKSAAFAKLMRDNNIHHYFSLTGSVAPIERVHRTLRGKLQKYMLKNDTTRFIDQLQNIVKSYNRTIHSTLGVSPINVNRQNQFAIYKRILNSQKPFKPRNFKFKVGDNVLISYKRTIFDRQFNERWSREIFSIARRYKNQLINMYKLSDCSNELVIGSFYENELQIVTEDPQQYYIIEKTLKKRGDESLVKLKYYPKKCAIWLTNKKIKTLRRA